MTYVYLSRHNGRRKKQAARVQIEPLTTCRHRKPNERFTMNILKQSAHQSFQITPLAESVAICEALAEERLNLNNKL